MTTNNYYAEEYDKLKEKFSKLDKKSKKKAYETWRDHFPPPYLENCECFLELLEIKPWKNSFIWRPRSKYRKEIVRLPKNDC